MMKKHIIIFIILIIPCALFGQKSHTIKGAITASGTEKVLEKVDIVVENATTGTISGSEGNYLLRMPEGEYEITYSLKDYGSKTITIILNANSEIDIELEKASDDHQNRKSDSGLLSLLFRGSKE